MSAFDPLVLLGIFALAGLGSMARLALARWEGFIPWGILTANIVASFIAGFASVKLGANESYVAIAVVGFAGGLSTFSSWAGATVQMAAKDKKLAPIVYTLATLILSSTAAYLGLLLG